MKAYKNGMVSWEYPELKTMYCGKEDILSLIDSIKETAEMICRQRAENVEQMKKSKYIIDKQIPDLLDNIETIKNRIGDYVDKSVQAEPIKNECVEMENKLIQYQKVVDLLCKRFENKKIRISSIGESSQGKSLFTHLYTGLPDEIVKVKNDVKDCTGAVNILHHKAGVEHQIEVTFYTKEAILDIINTYIEDIRRNDVYKNWTINNVVKFSSIEQVSDFCDNKNAQASLDELSAIDGGLIKGIKAYFKNNEYISELNQQPRHITISELPEFNDMQSAKSKCLAVKEINITTDLDHNGNNYQGLFENFEIADTKGASITAGSYANKEIFSAISNSDAVFSLCLINGAQKHGFYNTVLLNEYANDAAFKDKHFTILNLNKDLNYSSAEDTCEILEDLDLVNCIYIGKLVVKDEKSSDPQDFVYCAVLDMLNNISKKVAKFDNDNIRKCNEYCTDLNEHIKQLHKQLLPIEHVKYDEESLVMSKVFEYCEKTLDYIAMEQQNLTLEEEDMDENEKYENAVKKDKIKTVYELITREPYKKDVKNREEKEEIVDAIDDIYGTLIKYAENNNLNNANHVGQYVEDVAENLHSHLLDINKFAKQHDIEVKQRGPLFDKIWTIFELDKIFGDVQWNSRVIDNVQSPLLSQLNDIYKYKAKEGHEPIRYFFTSYDVLKEYFEDLDDDEPDEWTEANCLKPRIKDEHLKEVLVNILEKMEIRKLINNRIANKPEALRDIHILLINQLQHAKVAARNSMEFYKVHINRIVSNEDRDKINKSKNWIEVENARRKIAEAKVEELPIIIDSL